MWAKCSVLKMTKVITLQWSQISFHQVLWIVYNHGTLSMLCVHTFSHTHTVCTAYIYNLKSIGLSLCLSLSLSLSLHTYIYIHIHVNMGMDHKLWHSMLSILGFWDEHPMISFWFGASRRSSSVFCDARCPVSAATLRALIGPRSGRFQDDYRQ